MPQIWVLKWKTIWGKKKLQKTFEFLQVTAPRGVREAIREIDKKKKEEKSEQKKKKKKKKLK